jgi:hypothetical protein
MAERRTVKEIPKVLYKYRDERNFQHHHRLISRQEVFLARPSQYNDPFDCRIPIRGDLMTDSDKEEKVKEILRIRFTDETFIAERTQQIKEAKELYFSPLVRKEDKEMLDRWDSVAGVYSLSEVNNNILMWSHYANQHKGFVVGLWSEVLMQMNEFVHLDYINYTIDFPLIKGGSEIDEIFYKKFFYKSQDWHYEKEWRIVTLHPKNRLINLPKSAFAEIIFGSHMDNSLQEKMIVQIKKIFPDVKLLKAEDSTEKFEVIIKPL